MNFKLFNLNCWLLPAPFSVDNTKRLRQIISFIKKFEPDIITLQEVWLQKYVKILINKLPEYKIYSSAAIFNRGGLVTGLKILHLSCKKETFPITIKHNPIERLAKKGYHIITLANNVQIINTQLYMSNSAERYITKAQFYELQKQSENKRVILCGDLGIDDKEFMLTNGVFVYHPLNINTSSKKNKYHRMRFNKFMVILFFDFFRYNIRYSFYLQKLHDKQ